MMNLGKLEARLKKLEIKKAVNAPKIPTFIVESVSSIDGKITSRHRLKDNVHMEMPVGPDEYVDCSARRNYLAGYAVDERPDKNSNAHLRSVNNEG